MTAANFRVVRTVKATRSSEEAVKMAKRAVGERLASKGRVVGFGNVLTSAEVAQEEARPVTVYSVQVDIETPLSREKLARLFANWKLTELGSSKPALAGE